MKFVRGTVIDEFHTFESMEMRVAWTVEKFEFQNFKKNFFFLYCILFVMNRLIILLENGKKI